MSDKKSEDIDWGQWWEDTSKTAPPIAVVQEAVKNNARGIAKNVEKNNALLAKLKRKGKS